VLVDVPGRGPENTSPTGPAVVVGGSGQDGGMTVRGRLELVALDAPDIDRLAAFYTALTGWEIVRKESDWTTVRTGDGQEVAFQLAPDHVAPRWPGQEQPQQFHLDLLVDGYQAAAERAVALGATRLADGPTWVTLADPAGHPFDLCQRDGVGPVMGLFAPTIDAPDAVALARFYAELMGMEVTYEGPEGALVAGYGKRTSTSPSTTSTPVGRAPWSWVRRGSTAKGTGSGSSPTRPGTRSAWCCSPDDAGPAPVRGRPCVRSDRAVARAAGAGPASGPERGCGWPGFRR
jgi:catechol 2,3-dioxygenase-like lactoylglutathione lyase family enzyme